MQVLLNSILIQIVKGAKTPIRSKTEETKDKNTRRVISCGHSLQTIIINYL